MRTKLVGIALFVGILACMATAASATPTETGETGLVTMPTTDVLEPWHPSIGIHLNGEASDHNFDPVANRDVELWRTEFTLGIGLLPNLELTSQLPYVQFESDVQPQRHVDDIGGLRFGLKYRFLNEKDDAPLSVALLAGIVLGTGRDSFPAILDRNSAWGRRETYEVMAIADKIVWTNDRGKDVVLTLNAGGLFFDHPETFNSVNQSLQFQRRFRGPQATFETPFEFGVGLLSPLWSIDNFQIDLLGEFRGNTGTIDELQGSLPTWMFVGPRFAAANGLAIQGGIDFGLSGFLEPYRFIASLSYAMPGTEAPPPVARVAASPAPPPPPPPPAPAPKKKLILRGINFDFDKALVRTDAIPILQAAADTLKDNPEVDIIVEGHTDSKGTDAYNERLSVRRANAVRDRLAKLGVRASRMTVRGRGESQPVASNDTEEGRAQNRRVELLVQP